MWVERGKKGSMEEEGRQACSVGVVVGVYIEYLPSPLHAEGSTGWP